MKDNQPTSTDEVRLIFEREGIAACDCFETTDGDHGHIEIRRRKIIHDVSWLTTDRRFPGEPRFPALAMAGIVEAEVERGWKINIARRYYLSSAALNLFKSIPDKASMKVRRKTAAWEDDYLFNAVTQAK